MRRTALAFAVIVFFFLAQARAAEYPETTAGLEAMMKDTLDAVKADRTDAAKELINRLVLPNPEKFFTTTWGDEKGKALAEQYAKVVPKMSPELLKVFTQVVKENRSNIKAYKLESADDKTATGLQQDAIEAMKVKVPLYGVHLIEPGKEFGTHIFSFVYVDGGFRLVGKVGQRK